MCICIQDDTCKVWQSNIVENIGGTKNVVKKI